jgi:hypothetical protein
MINKISSDLVPLTKELALNFSQMRAMPGERPKKPHRLKHFRTKLTNGGFVSPAWAQALIADDPQPWRADGQHTSFVLANCDDDMFPANLKVTISTYQLDSMQDTGPLFDIFDNPKSVRSNLDKLGIYIAQHEDAIKAMDPSFLHKVLSGIHYFNFESTKVESGQETSSLLLPEKRELGIYLEALQTRQFAIWINRWNETKHTWMIGKPGITAEIYADWITHADIATQFWGLVLTESHPDADDDTRDLSRTFLEWAHRQPATNQYKFRKRAKTIWERFRRAHLRLGPDPEAVPEMPPPVTQINDAGQHEALA